MWYLAAVATLNVVHAVLHERHFDVVCIVAHMCNLCAQAMLWQVHLYGLQGQMPAGLPAGVESIKNMLHVSKLLTITSTASAACMPYGPCLCNSSHSGCVRRNHCMVLLCHDTLSTDTLSWTRLHTLTHADHTHG